MTGYAEADTAALRKMLALASKPGRNATQGELKADLAKVPADAAGLVVGKIPTWLGAGAPFPMPKSVLAHFRRDAGRVELLARAVMSDADAAAKLVETIKQARKAGVEALGKFKGQPIPGVNPKALIEVLESIEPRADGSAVQIRVRASPEAIIGLPAYLLY
ncbi:MAG: hypothetical protein FJ271_26175 [Planctomycetes bacterium]|nr:hypothetical protein [Planctomycetota bacterium]